MLLELSWSTIFFRVGIVNLSCMFCTPISTENSIVIMQGIIDVYVNLMYICQRFKYGRNFEINSI